MSYEIKVLKPFEKFYKKRTTKEKALINEKLMVLKNNPYDFQKIDIKKLKGYENRYRLRIMNYRILYEIHNEILVIVALDGDNRGDIYK